MYIKIICFLSFFMIDANVQASEIEMQPVLPEVKAFQYGTSSSNQVTPLMLKILDRSFFEQTGGGDDKIRDQRNTGTIKLILMVHEVLYSSEYGKMVLQTKEKGHLADEILIAYLGEHGLNDYVRSYFENNNSLNVDQVVTILEMARHEIFQKLGIKG